MLALLVRGLWWRRNTSLVILVASVITMGGAALGPVYARAAAESTLHDQLVGAGTSTGLHFENASGPHALGVTSGGFDAAQTRAPAAGSIHGYPSVIGSMSLATHASVDGGNATTSLVWRSGVCGHVVMVSGRCPSGAGDVIASQRTAAGYGWTVGKTILLTAARSSATIVGVYRPRDTHDTFWSGHEYFNAAPGRYFEPDTVDAVFTSRAGFSRLPAATRVAGYVDEPLDPDAIRLGDVPRLRHDIAALTATYKPASTFVLTTGVVGVLDAAAREQGLIDVGTALVTAQLVLLGWLVLFHIVGEALEARGPEIALAKLRGHGRWATVRFALTEPLVILVVAAPLGLVLARWGTGMVAAATLADGTPVIVTGDPVLAMAAALAGGLVAAALAARRVLTRPVLEQWRRTRLTTHSTRAGAIGDSVVAAAAIAGFVVLRTSEQAGASGNTAALLAPALLIAAIALIGTRLLPVAVRPLLPLTRAVPSRIGLFLASRQVARRPAGLRLAALLAVAVGLASFGVAAQAVSSDNRVARAQAELGASRTASIQYTPGVDPITAVRRADPSGTWAMAAATWLPDGGDTVVGTVLGVDASRFAAVASPTAGGVPATTVARTLTASSVPALTVRGTRIQAEITATDLTALRPEVQFDLLSARGASIAALADALQPGSHVYTADIPCAGGCAFVGLTWAPPASDFDPMGGSALVTGLAEGTAGAMHPLSAALTTAGGWRAARPSGSADDHVEITSAGLRDTFASSEGGFGGLAYASLPDPIPAIATRPAIATGTIPASGPQLVDEFGTAGTFRIRQWTPVVPVGLDDGVVMNLPYLTQALPGFVNEANWEVWLSPSAPPDALAKMRATGLVIQSTASEADRVAELARGGPALSLLLLLLAAIIGAVLAAFATAISIGTAGRRRSYETAALQAVGVPRRQLFAGAVFEQLILLLAAVVLGAPSGYLAAWLALPVVPEFTTPTPIALDYAPPFLIVLLFVAGAALLVVLGALVASHAVMRASAPSRLREAEE